MKKLVILALLVSSPAYACNSYDSCMDKSRAQKWLPMQKVYSDIALAYKLDDIHTTLKDINEKIEAR